MSTWLLPTFLEDPGFLSGFSYCSVAALAVHCHLLFGAALIAHALYFGSQYRQGLRVPAKYLLAVRAFFSVLLLPLF